MTATDTFDVASGCSVPGCRYRCSSKGLCKTHYERQRTGSPLGSAPVVNRKLLTEAQRWCSKVRLPDDPGVCWVWIGAHVPAGYGHFGGQPAHRRGYEMFIGSVPQGWHVDHLCRNPGCVNPAHLEAVTCRVNTMRGVGPSARNAAKTHCQNGHFFTPDSTYRTASGGRTCRQCKAEWARQHQVRPGVRERINQRVRERWHSEPEFREKRIQSARDWKARQ